MNSYLSTGWNKWSRHEINWYRYKYIYIRCKEYGSFRYWDLYFKNDIKYEEAIHIDHIIKYQISFTILQFLWIYKKKVIYLRRKISGRKRYRKEEKLLEESDVKKLQLILLAFLITENQSSFNNKRSLHIYYIRKI